MQMKWKPSVVGLGLALMGMMGCGDKGEDNYGTEVGSRAWSFALPDTTQQNINLVHYRGKRHVVLQFYLGKW